MKKRELFVKRVSALTLAALLAMTGIPAVADTIAGSTAPNTAYAADSTSTGTSDVKTAGDWQYTITTQGDGANKVTGASIVGYTGTADKTAIPDKVDNYSVLRVNMDNFTGTSLTLPTTATVIHIHSDTLTNLTIPESGADISILSFRDCNKLQSVKIPNRAVQTIDFSGCNSLSSVQLPSDLKKLQGEGYNGSFQGCKSLDTIELPSRLETIGNNSFNSCSALKTATIPNSVTSIGDSAFSDCTQLKNIQFPDSLNTIGNNAFIRCMSLTEISLPNLLKTMGVRAFEDCSSVKTIIIQNNLQYIPDLAFSGCINLKSINIPGSITSIGSNAFAYCTDLNLVNFGSSKYDWDNIKIFDQGNTYLKQAYRTYAKDDYRVDISNASIEMTSDVKSVIKRSNGYVDYPRVKKITYSNDELKAGSDYIIDYIYPNESKKQNTYKITITGIGRNFTGTKTIEYPVENAVDISKAAVTCTPNQVTYNENTREVTLPEIAVSYGGKTLTKGVDYQYDDTPVIDKYDSKARIYIRGLGKYEGNRYEEIPLKVIDTSKTDLSNAVVEFSPAYIIVNDNEDYYWPDFKIILDGKELSYKDYNYTHELNTDKKSGTITINGVGKYTGTIFKTINTHAPYDINKASITIDPESITGDQLYGEMTWPKILISMDGRELTDEGDYDIYIEPNANAGTATITINGRGFYTGTYTKTIKYTDTRKNTNAEIAALQTRIAELEQQIANLKGGETSSGSSTTNVIVDQAAKKQIEDLTKQVNELQSALKSMQNLIDQLNTTGKANTEMVIKLIKIDQLENVKAAASKGGLITFSWKKSDVNDLDAYRVYYSTKKNSGFKKLGTTKKLKLTRKVNIRKGKKIYLKVRGYKKVNDKTIWTKYSKVKSVRVK